MKKIIPVTICFLIVSLSLSSCGKEKAEDTARQQAEGDTGKVLVAFFRPGLEVMINGKPEEIAQRQRVIQRER